MMYETSQVLSLARLSPEQLRHWRKILPPLKGRDGRRNHYTFAEVASLAILSAGVSDLSLSISRFSVDAASIFEAIGRATLDTKAELALFITATGYHIGRAEEILTDDAIAIIRVSQVIRRLRMHIAAESGVPIQLHLPF